MRLTWSDIGRALTRPYPATGPMVALDTLLPLEPFWALVYGAFYAFLIVLPVIVVQQPEMIRRTVWAYISVWTVSYACFLLYPTVAPRPDIVPGDGFAVWGLKFLYDADPPYNCFPSIHVAHSFVSALACHRVHRTLGGIALWCSALVALSTLFTKQHYVADVVAGIALAIAANAALLRSYDRANIPESDRHMAPSLAFGVAGAVGLGLACSWALYLWQLPV